MSCTHNAAYGEWQIRLTYNGRSGTCDTTAYESDRESAMATQRAMAMEVQRGRF